jgi:hypothetical protein
MDTIMGKKGFFVALIGVVVLAGCATAPTGPTVTVFPSPWKPFEIFQAEDAVCRQWAAQQVGAPPGAPINQNAALGATVGTLVGAGLGAAIGAAAGNPGAGAAIGAGTGLLGGAASGANADWGSAWGAQQRYDMAFQQCMYAKGNQVPGVIPYRQSGQTFGVPPPPPPPSGQWTPGIPPPRSAPPPPPAPPAQ